MAKRRVVSLDLREVRIAVFVEFVAYMERKKRNASFPGLVLTQETERRPVPEDVILLEGS